MKKLGMAIKSNLAEVLAVLLCLAVLGGFVSVKEGFHMDELLSFELANAEFNPWIVPTQPEGRLAKFVRNEIRGESPGETISNLVSVAKDVAQNRGNSRLLTYKADVYEEPVWITAEQFRNYITVGTEDAFNYLSVYFNVKDDNHPPFHFMLLHTVSSVFRGRAEAWMGCLINLLAIAAVMILLMRIGRILFTALGLGEGSRTFGILSALFYGISAGAVATALLIRMYGVLTLWCVAYFYLVLKKWQDRGYESHNIRLILVTALGFWTQYFFLFYCICLALAAAAALLYSRRFRECVCFVRSMVIAAVLGVAVYPFSIVHVFSSGRGVEALENLSKGLSGYGTRIGAFLKILGDRTFSPWFWILLALAAVTVCVLRKVKMTKEPATSGRGTERIEARRNRIMLLWMLLFPIGGYFLLAARMSPYLVDRYIMPLFPFVILAGVLALVGLLSALEGVCPSGWGRKAAAAAYLLVFLLQAFGLLRYDGNYLYRGYGEQEKTAAQYADHSCICVYAGVGYYENLREFTHYRETLLLTLEELEGRRERESIESLEDVVVLIKGDVDDKRVLAIMEESYGFQAVQDIGFIKEKPYGDTVILMRKDS